MKFIRKHIPFTVEKDGEDAFGDRIVEGYVSTFETPERHDSHGDIILPGAFKQAIEEHNAGGFQIKFFLRHRIGIGKMIDMREDARGLYIKARVSETRDGDDALTLVKDGVLDSLSIGFMPAVEDFEDLEVMSSHNYPVRAWSRIRLKEGSLTEIPSNEFALVTEVRSARLGEYTTRVDLAAKAAEAAAEVEAHKAERLAEAERLAAMPIKCARLGAVVTSLIKAQVDTATPHGVVVSLVAEMSGAGQERLAQIMSGEAADVSAEVLKGIGAALDHDPAELLDAVKADGAVAVVKAAEPAGDEAPPEDTPSDSDAGDDEADALEAVAAAGLKSILATINKSMLDPSI